MKSKRVNRKVIFGLPNNEYHGKKYKDYISSSKIKDIVKKGLYSTVNAPEKTAKHLDLGTAAHAYFFERDNYHNIVKVLSSEKIDGRTEAGKSQNSSIIEFKEANKGMVVLFPSEQEAIEKMWENFERVYPEYAKQFLDNQKYSELSVTVENWRGRKARVRFDHRGESKFGTTGFDLKTMYDDITPEVIRREVRKWQYDIQDCMYREVGGLDAFIFIAVKTSHPFTAQCFRITREESLVSADLKIDYALEKYEEYEENPDKLLPTYEGEILGI